MRGNNVNRKYHARVIAGLAVIALVAASCGSDSDTTSDSAAPADTEAAVEETTAPADTEPADTAPADTEPTDTAAPDGGEGFTRVAGTGR